MLSLCLFIVHIVCVVCVFRLSLLFGLVSVLLCCVSVVRFSSFLCVVFLIVFVGEC